MQQLPAISCDTMKHQYITHVWINGFINGLSDLGIELSTLEKSIPDLNIDRIRSGQRVNTTLLRQMWHTAGDLSGDPLLGFRLGRRVDIKGLGALAPLLIHSPTVRISIEHVAQFHSLINQSGHLQVTYAEDGMLGFHYAPVPGVIRESPHQVLSLLTSMIYMGKFMYLKQRSVDRIYLPPELDLKLIERTLNIQTLPANGQCSMWFKVDELDDPIPGTDTHLYHLAKNYLEEHLQQQQAGNDLVASIKSLVVENGYLRASVDAVTEQLEINKRTLQRVLTDEKTSFRMLKEELIKDRALTLIAQNKKTLEQIAEQLGYSEVSAFHRAFKNWFGVTPKNFSTNAFLLTP